MEKREPRRSLTVTKSARIIQTLTPCLSVWISNFLRVITGTNPFLSQFPVGSTLTAFRPELRRTPLIVVTTYLVHCHFVGGICHGFEINCSAPQDNTKRNSAVWATLRTIVVISLEACTQCTTAHGSLRIRQQTKWLDARQATVPRRQ